MIEVYERHPLRRVLLAQVEDRFVCQSYSVFDEGNRYAQVVCVIQVDSTPGTLYLFGCQSFESALSCNRHEDGQLDRPVRKMQNSSSSFRYLLAGQGSFLLNF